MTFITRFAPSPTGPLHLGHAYSALLAQDMARDRQGVFLLRIDDIDQSRARANWEAQIYDDLQWLGVSWPEPVRRQSEHFRDYEKALDHLVSLGLTYPCSCKRRDIEAAAGAPQEGVPQFGPDGRIYPGTCRQRDMAERTGQDVIRLNMRLAANLVTLPVFTETGAAHAGEHVLDRRHLTDQVGDIVLERQNMAASYHLSVVVDDAQQEISHVIRGEDLFEATLIHVLLQRLLGLPTPVYHHHRLIRDEAGKRLAKRDDARSIARFRSEGATPAEVRLMAGL